MTPDRMVVAEAMRTFTYLNLYGYLTDAVVVNRVFPAEVDGTYFGAWRELQAEQLALVRVRLRPGARSCARRTSSSEVVGAGDARPPRRRGVRRARPGGAAARLGLPAADARRRAAPQLRLELPFARKGDVSLKKIGLELIVRVDGQKRTIMLPPTLAPLRPASASFEDGALLVRFAGD